MVGVITVAPRSLVGGDFGGSLPGRISSASTHAEAPASSTADANIAVACFMAPTLRHK